MGGKSHVEEQISLSSQPLDSMGCRFGICDLHRAGSSITLSPDHRLAAVVDTLGRVSLIDVRTGVTLRMLKGHRDAQCAFIQVRDEKKSRHHSSPTAFAMFLIAYSPKKGVIEIFSTQQAVKVASFTASKHSRLLYSNYGLVGFGNNTKSNYVCHCTCALVDPDGQVKEISVPFHFALSEKNSKRARDVHIYKRLKQFVKTNNSAGVTEVLSFCSELKTSEIKLQSLEMLSGYKGVDPEVVLKASALFSEQLQDSAEEEIDSHTKQLKVLSENLSSLASFYVFIRNCVDNPSDQEQINTKFYWGHKELSNLQRLFDLSTSNGYQKFGQAKVTFEDDVQFDFSSFLSVYNLSSRNKICLKNNLDPPVLFLVGKQMFEDFILGNRSDYEGLRSEALKSNIETQDLLLKILLPYWLSKEGKIGNDPENETIHLSKLVYVFTKMEPADAVTVKYNRISRFWTGIRDILADSACPFSALTAALTCRAVAQKIENEREMEMSGGSGIEDDTMEIWEKLSQEKCEWMLLIGKLEDVSLLSIILSGKPAVSKAEFCQLPKLKCEPKDISLKYILEKGRGVVSELMARWLAAVGINPDCLIYNDLMHQVSA